jgi:hypothetical protein
VGFHKGRGRGGVAEDEVHYSGEYPEGDRDPEGDEGIALSSGESAELAALLSDVLIGARDTTHLRAVEGYQDHAQGQKHQEHYRERCYGPAEEGDGRA